MKVAVIELMRSLGGSTVEFVFLGVTYFFPYYFHFQKGPLTTSTQEAGKHSDLFSSSSPLDKGTKSRTKTVLSLFDEEEDKTEDQNSIQAPKKEVGKVSKKAVKVQIFRRIKKSHFMVLVLSCELLKN